MNDRTQGAAVLTMAAAGVGLAVFTYSRDAFVLLVWALGASAVWYAVRKPNKIDNPSPTPESDPSPQEKPQVSITEDPDRPGHWIVNHKQTGTP